MEQIIRDTLISDIVPTLSNILDQFDAYETAHPLSQPVFIANNYKVSAGDISSAATYNELLTTVHQDLRALYKQLIKTSVQTCDNMSRWRNEATLLESRLKKLEGRITNLLLLTEDTAGYFNFVYDTFSDTSKTDLTNTTATVDIKKGSVIISPASTTASRIDLADNIDPTKDIEFTLLTRSSVASTVSTQRSSLKNAVSGLDDYWQEKVYTTSPITVSAEFKVKLSTSPIQINRIDVDLNDSSSSSPTQITPMYSTDNYNFYQIPSTTTTASVTDQVSFKFTPVSASVVKLIMTKTRYDQVVNNQYLYEFGLDNFSVFNETYKTSTSVGSAGYIFYSKPLSITTKTGTEDFSKVSLEVCENIPASTSIDYAIAVSNTSTVPISTSFISLDPVSRSSTTLPTVLDFSEINVVSVSGVKVSYDKTEGDHKFINPDKDFTILQSASGTSATEATAVASAQRYVFLNSNDRILDHCVASGIQIATGTLEIWRNLHTLGSSDKVREVSNGWGFSDPYYSTTVYVGNANGVTIDFGSKTLIVNGIAKSGSITFAQGNYKLSVHKSNWKEVDLTDVADLSDLKTADTLYPYNHRYLIEGLAYPANWSSTDERIYRGFDIVAEYLMKEVSVLDFTNNVAATDFAKYAIDKDLADTACVINGSTTSKPPMDVFLVKVDEGKADFDNEQYLLKFKTSNILYRYLRLRATLKTTDTSLTPRLDSYRIKLGT